jgi:hypothetical protein
MIVTIPRVTISFSSSGDDSRFQYTVRGAPMCLNMFLANARLAKANVSPTQEQCLRIADLNSFCLCGWAWHCVKSLTTMPSRAGWNATS